MTPAKRKHVLLALTDTQGQPNTEQAAMQEHEHLRITVERVADYKPDVLLVEKSVARYAQELLLQKGISVVLNVKRSLLNRLARCTEAQVNHFHHTDHTLAPAMEACCRWQEHVTRFILLMEFMQPLCILMLTL